MRALRYLALIVLLAVAFGGGWLSRDRRTAGAPATADRRVLYYVDPMHPSYTSDKPGIAPDCGMALEPVYADASPPAAVPERKVLYYRDPEVPSYTATTAGLNPETGNTLEPVYAEGAAPMAHAGAIRIPAERQQRAGVTFATVEATDAGRIVRAVGTVAYDEASLQRVHARADGWIEQVHVDATGQRVERGQPMLTIYSPELLASQEELLLARRARDVMRNSPLGSAADQGEALLRAARRRLELWRLSEAQIQQVLETGTPIRDITLYAPVSGVVLQRNAFPNQRVTTDSDLYTLANLDRVWVMANVYEADFAAIRTGAPARVLPPPGTGARPVSATVEQIQPAVDPLTRTLEARLGLRNPGWRLRPGMYVDVEFPLAGERRLTVPADAVLDSGDRQVVFVDLGQGYLVPKDVRTGERIGDRIVVTSGLSEGESVVASGTFLIDAETRLRPAAGRPAGHDHD